MSARLRVLVVYGTRPEVIKLAPVVRALRAHPDRVEVVVATTAQHRHMVDQAQAMFGLRPDVDLDLMAPDQGLNPLAARVLDALDPVLVQHRPDWLLVQGDTTTALAAGLAGFHREVAVGHVEAGLRTGDLARPFPEEGNRRLLDVVARALFAPTARAAAALAAEGIDADRIHLVGNTVVDAVREVAGDGPVPARADEVLVTLHRREAFGPALEGMVSALATLARQFPATRFVLPVHPNPNVREPIERLLADVANVERCAPLDYPVLLEHLRRARLVLTDSGGIQEEAPAFGTPVLVLRDVTERPEGVEAGVARLVGADGAALLAVAAELLADPARLDAMARVANPYGDGRASERIVAQLLGDPWTPFTPHT